MLTHNGPPGKSKSVTGQKTAGQQQQQRQQLICGTTLNVRQKKTTDNGRQ